MAFIELPFCNRLPTGAQRRPLSSGRVGPQAIADQTRGNTTQRRPSAQQLYRERRGRVLRLQRRAQHTILHEDLNPLRHARRKRDRKSTRLNSSHLGISYAVFCLKKKKKHKKQRNKNYKTNQENNDYSDIT